MRKGVVIQPADVQDRHGQINGRLSVRRVELSRCPRMPINAQAQVEGSLDVRYCAFHVQHHAIGMGDGDRQAVRLREVHERLVILFRRPKSLRELLGRQVAAVVGAGRVVELLEQGVKFLLISQRQANGQVQTVRGRENANRGQAC